MSPLTSRGAVGIICRSYLANANITLAGNVAIESMIGEWGSVEPLWFGGGRVDAFAPEEDVYWVRAYYIARGYFIIVITY